MLFLTTVKHVVSYNLYILPCTKKNLTDTNSQDEPLESWENFLFDGLSCHLPRSVSDDVLMNVCKNM